MPPRYVHLISRSERHDACCDVDSDAIDVKVRLLHLSGAQTDPYGQADVCHRVAALVGRTILAANPRVRVKVNSQ
jgi:hypothetical protein